LTIRQVAAELRQCERTVRNLVKRKKLVSFQSGRSRRFTRDAVDRYKLENTSEATNQYPLPPQTESDVQQLWRKVEALEAKIAKLEGIAA
jgi:excisionase family DNA binding protein